MKPIDYFRKNIVRSCSTKEFFDKGIFILDNSSPHILPLEYTLFKELYFTNKTVSTYKDEIIGRFSIANEIDKSLYLGLLSEIYLQLHKKKGIHTHKSKLCPESCDFQIIFKKSRFLINKWLSDLGLPVDIEQSLIPNFCINCLKPHRSKKEVPEDFLCSRTYRERKGDYVCRQVYYQEFINKLLPTINPTYILVDLLVYNKSDFEKQLDSFKQSFKYVSKRIAKKIYSLKDEFKNLDLKFSTDIKTIPVKIDEKIRKEISQLIEREMIDADMINASIKNLKLSSSQAKIFKKNLRAQFKPAIEVVHKGKREYFKNIPPEYSLENISN